MRICPMLAVENMESTLEFYSLVLGFSPIMQTDSYSVVDRDGTVSYTHLTLPTTPYV